MVGLTLVFIVVLVFKEREEEKNEVVEWRFCFRKKLKFKNCSVWFLGKRRKRTEKGIFFKFMFISIRS